MVVKLRKCQYNLNLLISLLVSSSRKSPRFESYSLRPRYSDEFLRGDIFKQSFGYKHVKRIISFPQFDCHKLSLCLISLQIEKTTKISRADSLILA